MGRFVSELHCLCEEAKWNDVKAIILHTLQSQQDKTNTTQSLSSRSKGDFDGSSSFNDLNSSKNSNYIIDKEKATWDYEKLSETLVEREGPHLWTPLMIACVRAPLDVIALLCHAGPDACLIPDRSGSLPLHFVSCWRRGGFVEETTAILRILTECSPQSIAHQNTWGQTPLHSLLDSKTLPPLSAVKALIGSGLGKGNHNDDGDGDNHNNDHEYLDHGNNENDLDETNYFVSALATPDGQNRLPLHIAAAKGASEDILGFLVASFPDATFVANGKGDLAAHLLHNASLDNKDGGSCGAMESLLLPLAVGSQPRQLKKDDRRDLRPKTWSQLHSLVKQLEKEYEGTGPQSLEYLESELRTSQPPTTPAQVACRCGGTKGDILPIHLAAFHGVQFEVIRGICRQYPEGAKKTCVMPKFLPAENEEEDEDKSEQSTTDSQSDDTDNNKAMCPLEIFENGRAGREAASAAKVLQNVVAYGKDGAPSSHLEKLNHVLASFYQRADLLLAYNFNAFSSGGVRYREESDRLRRIEQIIRRDAKDPNAQLTDASLIVWPYFCRYQNPNDSLDNYVKNVGRVVTGLDPTALWKLTLFPSPVSLGEDIYIKVECTGRTVAFEAELRAPSVSMENVMKLYWLQYMLTSYLDSVDALNYSLTCRRTRAVGVRLLPQVPLRVTEAHWEKPSHVKTKSPPKPWQRLDVLVVPDCTHTVFVSYYLECKQSPESTTEMDHRAFGGMLLVRDDNRKLRPNASEPWGDAVVAYSKIPPVNGSLVRLSFPHVPGRSYGLWHYNHGEPGSSLSVSDVRVRQLIHSCDSRGRSPLHLLLSSMAESSSPNPRLDLLVSMLLAAKFGTGDAVGDVPLHYALKCGVNEDVLQAIITASPPALVETDKEGRTPIHAAFLLSRDEPPPLGVIRALLTTPGENAIKLKDSSGRLPLHIATERGAGEAILRLLVEAYQDGCYRTNKDGDLPIHLLLRSGAATTSSVELLLRPIMQNESICRIGGSRGTNLPLHIATEYQCPYRVLEKLLQTYGDAAMRPKTTSQKADVEHLASGEKSAYAMYALDIFEQGRDALSHDANENDDMLDDADDADLDSTSKAKEAAMQDVTQADFDLRSDLIFVYNPFLISKATGRPYRNDKRRIKRLANMIRREAIQCGEDRKINRRAKLTDMAKQAWIFLCTYSDPDNPSDHYAGTVRKILRGLSAGAVDVLAHVENQRMSDPLQTVLVKDCATPLCSVLILSRMRFVGRYVLYDEVHPVHKSESCLVMRANDFGLADEYERIMSIYKAQEQDVEEDISDAGSIDETKIIDGLTRPNAVTMEMFLIFAERVGVETPAAKTEIEQLMKMYADEPNPGATVPKRGEFDSDDDEDDASKEGKVDEDETMQEIGKEAFATFCRNHRLDEKGVRTVVIKFMKNYPQFQREKELRSTLDLSGTSWPVVPILDDYNVDRIEKSRKRDIDIYSLRDDADGVDLTMAPENRDELYALDILEKNASVHNFALYKYAVVMPAGDRDLAEICQHEELGILQIRKYIYQVGTGLKCLHDQSSIHADLKMANVVRFDKNLALIDFDSSCNFEKRPSNSKDKMGGASSKFCTGGLPPEMIEKIDLQSDYQKLTQYETYWRKVSEDAKDLNLLTPDDIQAITSVVKALLVKADVAKNLENVQPIKSLRDEMNEMYSTLENRDDWKDILSISLITISFEDLPYSLNCCDDVEEFSTVWNRLLFHSKLWAKIRPRISADDRYAYLIKTYNDMPNETGLITAHNKDSVPYDLVSPSEKIDVWAFGTLLFALCSCGSIFPVGFDGDLSSSLAFAELYEWNKERAEKKIKEKIDDPLAQDLLMQILVPETERLTNMETVLKHPFFGSSSGVEAQRILEKHEEEQLIIEETVLVQRMTTEMRRVVENSMEKHCKIIFDEEKIVVPTCIMVLPYELQRNSKGLSTATERDYGLGMKMGEYLLAINKATAKLSFWLLMKKNIGSDKTGTQFKSKMKNWLKRARAESAEAVAADIVQKIGCEKTFLPICLEMLLENDSVSNAKAFLKDPMQAARQEVNSSTQGLLQCYKSSSQYLYLVDEYSGMPVHPEEGVDEYNEARQIYPIVLDKNNQLTDIFLTFMNLVFGKKSGEGGLSALSKLLGLPYVPKSWNEYLIGLVHSVGSASIAEFAVLQHLLRSNGPRNEMAALEDFFREKDPMRTFSELRRVSDGKNSIWTTDYTVNKIQSDVELANLEHKLRDLRKEFVARKQIQKEIIDLNKEIKKLKGIDDNTSEEKKDDRSSFSNGNGPSRSPTSRKEKPASPQQQQQQQQSSLTRKESKRKKMRKRNNRRKGLRLYFGAC